MPILLYSQEEQAHSLAMDQFPQLVLLFLLGGILQFLFPSRPRRQNSHDHARKMFLGKR